jgi:hypothetical protein
MIGEIGGLVLAWLIDLAAAALEFLAWLARRAMTPVRFACSARFRTEWHTTCRTRPAQKWTRLVGGSMALGLLLLLAAWGTQFVVATRMEPPPDQHVRTETSLGHWALGVVRRVYRERAETAVSGP